MSTHTDLKKNIDCNICVETVRVKDICSCPFCNFRACIDCVSRFLMEIDDTVPRCMNPDCKKVWTFEFVAEVFPVSFHNRKYRERRASILLQREKSLLPGTQPLVQRKNWEKDIHAQIYDIVDENKMLKLLLNKNNERIRILYASMRMETKEEEKTKKTFTRACPVEDCRGFLSTSLKCGVCSTFSCRDCHLPKACKNDEDHKCNPDTVATVKLLANDTKSCPGCSTLIFKIEGCDQIWCTNCHTAFSWENGKIETGRIHNPHYYEFQRQQNGGVAPRVQGDIRCGGVPNITLVSNCLKQAEFDDNDIKLIYNAHRIIAHITYVVIPMFPVQLGDTDNSDLRVKYLMNEITEKKWKSNLKAIMKKQEKNVSINQILTMFTSTLTDLFGNIVSDSNVNNTYKYVLSMWELRTYTNKNLAKIGYQYNNVVPYIEKDWFYISNRNNKGK